MIPINDKLAKINEFTQVALPSNRRLFERFGYVKPSGKGSDRLVPDSHRPLDNIGSMLSHEEEMAYNDYLRERDAQQAQQAQQTQSAAEPEQSEGN